MFFNTKEIGNRVRALRERNELTIEELANQVNCSRSHLSQGERGMRNYSIDILIDLSEIFDVSLDYLVLGRAATNNNARKELMTIAKQLTYIANHL